MTTRATCLALPGTKPSKRKAARIAKENEDRLIASANTRRFVGERSWEPPSSDYSIWSRRSDPLVDRTALAVLDKKLASGGHFGFTATLPRTVRLRPTSELNKLKRWGAKHSLSRKAQHILTKVEGPVASGTAYLVHVNNWDHASEVWKTLAWVASIPVGQRIAFTLNLTPEMARRAIRSKEGPAKYMQDRIASELRKAFPKDARPVFAMQLETITMPRQPPDILNLHIHGVAEHPGEKQDMDRVKEALRRSAGRVEGAARARILMIRPAQNPVGWTAYMYKHRLTTAKAIRDTRHFLGCARVPGSDTVAAASAPLRAKAQAWFNARREDRDLTWCARKKAIASTWI